MIVPTVALNPAPSFVQSGSALTNVSGSTLAITMGQAMAVGNQVIVFVRVSIAAAITGVVVAGSAATLLGTSVVNGAFNEYVYSLASVVNGGSTAVSVALDATGLTAVAMVYEASGAGVVDAIAGATGTGTASVSVTPVYANTLLVAAAFGDNVSTNPHWTGTPANARIALHDATAGAYLLGDSTLTGQAGVPQTAQGTIGASTSSVIALTLRHS